MRIVKKNTAPAPVKTHSSEIIGNISGAAIKKLLDVTIHTWGKKNKKRNTLYWMLKVFEKETIEKRIALGNVNTDMFDHHVHLLFLEILKLPTSTSREWKKNKPNMYAFLRSFTKEELIEAVELGKKLEEETGRRSTEIKHKK